MMQRQSILYGKAKASCNFVTKPNTKLGSTSPSQVKSRLLRARNPSTIIKTRALEVSGFHGAFGHVEARVATGNLGELSEEDDDLCPVECVREFRTDEELSKILERARESGALVVVDFYRTSCGSCKYIEQGFSKLCKGAGDGEAAVIFLKHNVIDEYDEQSRLLIDLGLRRCPSSTSIKTESSWKHSLPETKRGSLQPLVNTQLQLLNKFEQINEFLSSDL